MNTITINDLKAEQTRLAKMIAAFEAQARQSVHISEQRIDLAPGEHYAGVLVGKDGEASHHLIMLPTEGVDLNWSAAQAWAQENGGELPTRREQALLFANLRECFQSAWYWSSEPHEDGRYAWAQDFNTGSQGYDDTYSKFRARAVRRLEIQ